LDQSDNVYAYTTTGRDGGKTEKDSRLNTETYTYARASNLDRVAADSDSDVSTAHLHVTVVNIQQMYAYTKIVL
jgi:hypothetical protein